MSQRTSSTRGFSLVEVMLVVTILGILAALAVPSMADANRRRQQQELALRLEGALNSARDVARGELRCVTAGFNGLTFVASTHPCAPVGSAPLIPYAASYSAGIPDAVDREVQRIVATSDVAASLVVKQQTCVPPLDCPAAFTHGFGDLFEFHPDGSIDAPAIVTLTFNDGTKVVLDVHAATGTVRRRP